MDVPSEMKYTKYEKARIIGARALQLSMGAPFMLKLSDGDLSKLRYSCLEIAKLEFEKGVIPIAVRRPFPKIVREEPVQIKESFENNEDNDLVADNLESVEKQ